jgi:hypothetical protein
MLGQGSLFAFSRAARAALGSADRRREQFARINAERRRDLVQRPHREVHAAGLDALNGAHVVAGSLREFLLGEPGLSELGNPAPHALEQRCGLQRHTSRVRLASVQKPGTLRPGFCFCVPSIRWRSLTDHFATPNVGVKMARACPFRGNSASRGATGSARCSAAGGTFNDGAISYDGRGR